MATIEMASSPYAALVVNLVEPGAPEWLSAIHAECRDAMKMRLMVVHPDADLYMCDLVCADIAQIGSTPDTGLALAEELLAKLTRQLTIDHRKVVIHRHIVMWRAQAKASSEYLYDERFYGALRLNDVRVSIVSASRTTYGDWDLFHRSLTSTREDPCAWRSWPQSAPESLMANLGPTKGIDFPLEHGAQDGDQIHVAPPACYSDSYFPIPSPMSAPELVSAPVITPPISRPSLAASQRRPARVHGTRATQPASTARPPPEVIDLTQEDEEGPDALPAAPQPRWVPNIQGWGSWAHEWRQKSFPSAMHMGIRGQSSTSPSPPARETASADKKRKRDEDEAAQPKEGVSAPATKRCRTTSTQTKAPNTTKTNGKGKAKGKDVYAPATTSKGSVSSSLPTGPVPPPVVAAEVVVTDSQTGSTANGQENAGSRPAPSRKRAQGRVAAKPSQSTTPPAKKPRTSAKKAQAIKMTTSEDTGKARAAKQVSPTPPLTSSGPSPSTSATLSDRVITPPIIAACSSIFVSPPIVAADAASCNLLVDAAPEVREADDDLSLFGAPLGSDDDLFGDASA